MKKVGVIIAYRPGVISASDGLTRLLCFLLQGFMDKGLNVEIICPEWCRKDLDNLFRDTGITVSPEQIEVITTQKIPPIITLHSRFHEWSHRARRPSYFNRIFLRLKEQNEVLISRIAGTHSWAVLIAGGVLGVLLSPILVVSGLFILALKKALRFLNRIFTYIAENTIEPLSQPLTVFKNDLFFRRIFNVIEQNEYKKLVLLAQKQGNTQSWLIPTPFWPDIAVQLPDSVVVCPDIVFTEFPVAFERIGIGKQQITLRSQIEDSLLAAKHIIVYSNYVKSSQISSKFAITERKISVIPHGHISLEDFLNILKPFKVMTPQQQRGLCLHIVHNYLYTNSPDPYLRNFDFSGLRFIFFTSQIRPNKNISMLIYAFNRVLRERHEPIKLLLTCNPNEELLHLVSTLGLERDVLFLPRIPTQIMAALYHLSTIAVNPTLFEGGFPFTFSEAYSVGTPSIMSRIPVVEEFITEPELRRIMLFDPYNVDAIAERIYWGLHHHDELLDIERPLYERLKERSWAQVSAEYLDVLNGIE